MEDILITIRRMELYDTASVAELEADSFSEPWQQQDFANAVADDKYIYLVALDKDVVVGYAGCFVVADSSDITNIAINKEYRRLGIGAKLLEILKEQAMLKGAKEIFLEVRESNEAAIKLYYKSGFDKVGMRKNFYSKPTENAIIMQNNLNG